MSFSDLPSKSTPAALGRWLNRREKNRQKQPDLRWTGSQEMLSELFRTAD